MRYSEIPRKSSEGYDQKRTAYHFHMFLRVIDDKEEWKAYNKA